MNGYCDRCNNTGWIDCYCGGDLCVCDNNGEEPCPKCGGGTADDDDDFFCDEPAVKTANRRNANDER